MGISRTIDAIAGTPEPQPSGLVLRCYADIAPESLRWLWPNRIPLGKISMLIGDPGLGKSLVSVDIASRITRGIKFPDGTPCETGSVIFLSAEDDPADTIRPRLDAAGADVRRVHSLDAVRVRLADGAVAEKSFSLETDIAALESVLHQDKSIRLIMIDPISAYLGAVDSHRNAEVRGLLTPLKELAARHSVAILGVSHFRKSGGSAIHRSIDSMAFVAAARAAWGVAPHPEDGIRRVMLPIKQNLGPDAGGLTFDVEAPNGTAKIKWGEAIFADSNLVLGGTDNREEHGRLEDAKAWLVDLLSEGPVPTRDVKRQAADAGHNWTTVERAKTELKAVASKTGFGAGWQWSLSEDRHPKHSDLTVFEKPTENTEDINGKRSEDRQVTAFVGPPPTSILCATCGELQPSRAVYARHLDTCGKGAK